MNRFWKLVITSGLFGCLQLSHASLVNVDLSGWTSEGSGNWNVASDNNSVFQSVNGQPTVFFEPGSLSQGEALSGEITVQTTGDDDFIGFVLGYNSGELSSPGEFWLVDWKQNDQGAAAEGLALSKVTGSTTNDFWAHAGGVTEVQRATNLGSTGWLDNTTYSFDLVFTASLIQVYVDDVLEISYSGTFSDGAFGFYNYSQGSVRYAGITTQDSDNFVSAPGAMLVMTIGIFGLIARRLQK